MSTDQEGTIERPEDIGESPGAIVKRWQMECELAEKAEKKWRDAAGRNIDRYRGAKMTSSRFNILWSNTQTLLPALYQKSPLPDVRRRYRDEDPIGRTIAEGVERALAFSVDNYDFDSTIRSSVLDYLLTGRGVVRVRYNPHILPVEDAPPPLAASVAPKAESPAPPLPGLGAPLPGAAEAVPILPNQPFPLLDPEQAGAADATAQADQFMKELGEETLEPQEPPLEEVAYEEVTCEPVEWDDFLISPARRWDHVRWVRFCHRLTRKELEELSPEMGGDVPLDWAPAGFDDADNTEKGGPGDAMKRALVWEIWDKETRQVLFIAPSFKVGPLKVEEDPLGLRNFFPVPRPLYSIPAPDSLVPIPEYQIYEEQAKELNEVSRRINNLTKALKARGVYDSTILELQRVMDEDDNALIPSDGVTSAMAAGGLDRAIWFMPIEVMAGVLRQLYASREQIKQTIYEITGIADIIRGATHPQETATAQSLKARFGSLRLDDRRRQIQRFIRDIFRLKAEIIAEHFAPDTLGLITGVEVTDDMLRIMRADVARGVRIDVESDITVGANLAEEQQAMTQLLTAVTQYVTGVAPLVAQGIMPLDAAKALLLSATRRFQMGREVEDTLMQIGEGGDPLAALAGGNPLAALLGQGGGAPPGAGAVPPTPPVPGAPGAGSQAGPVALPDAAQPSPSSGPSPEMQAEKQLDLQVRQMETQMKLASAQQQAQLDQARHQMELERLQLERLTLREQMELKRQEQQLKLQDAALRQNGTSPF